MWPLTFVTAPAETESRERERERADRGRAVRGAGPGTRGTSRDQAGLVVSVSEQHSATQGEEQLETAQPHTELPAPIPNPVWTHTLNGRVCHDQEEASPQTRLQVRQKEQPSIPTKLQLAKSLYLHGCCPSCYCCVPLTEQLPKWKILLLDLSTYLPVVSLPCGLSSLLLWSVKGNIKLLACSLYPAWA